ncbi:TetR family transcriptional regulator [Tersicoccus solisilvae]|uniref:TetR family transcriptional regulator n=1 Tax=Tersicoccus solisilvae TaxID=1882339 RepID=A0ABQ1P9V9_9MICC|nr:TetR/AcrR family transcriptional regulator [Tersicoccus solisilvae]GGC89628.1 TetR family transcriptional regulator [Tersicoccus solisilvae]
MIRTAGTDPDIRVRLLDAAAAAFTRRGFAQTTIDDIALAVGGTKGLVYYHFRSKFDVFLAVYDRGVAMVREAVDPLADAPGSGLERLRPMATAHVMNLMENFPYHSVVHQGVRDQSSESLTVGQRDALVGLNRSREEYELMFRRVIAEGIADGSLRPVDAALAARVLLSSLNAVDLWFRQRQQSEDSLRAMAGDVVDLIIGGITA